jgi:hypothetical protein
MERTGPSASIYAVTLSPFSISLDLTQQFNKYILPPHSDGEQERGGDGAVMPLRVRRE